MARLIDPELIDTLEVSITREIWFEWTFLTYIVTVYRICGQNWRIWLISTMKSDRLVSSTRKTRLRDRVWCQLLWLSRFSQKLRMLHFWIKSWLCSSIICNRKLQKMDYKKMHSSPKTQRKRSKSITKFANHSDNQGLRALFLATVIMLVPKTNCKPQRAKSVRIVQHRQQWDLHSTACRSLTMMNVQILSKVKNLSLQIASSKSKQGEALWLTSSISQTFLNFPNATMRFSGRSKSSWRYKRVSYSKKYRWCSASCSNRLLSSRTIQMTRRMSQRKMKLSLSRTSNNTQRNYR